MLLIHGCQVLTPNGWLTLWRVLLLVFDTYHIASRPQNCICFFLCYKNHTCYNACVVVDVLCLTSQCY